MKGNNTKARLWWIVVLGSILLTVKSYETVNFTTMHADGESYSEFLQLLRDKLASGKTSHGIPLLADESAVPNSQRYILVQLQNWANSSITLALDVTNLSIAGYKSGNNSYFLGDNFGGSTNHDLASIFSGTIPQFLPIGNTYPQLEKFAGPRAKIDLGIMALEQAISGVVVENNVTSYQQNLTAKSLIVINQIISEAARFRNIEQRVRWSIRNNRRFRPDVGILSLQNQWRAISSAIQASSQGVFPSPVQLQGSNRSYFTGDTVTNQFVSNLALMFVTCKNQSKSSSCGNNLEPTVRIPGPNALCIDVYLGRYNDGNKIQLWGCKNNTHVNQLWTLKKDGTIRSDGKCLTTSGFTPGSYVVIYNCTIASSNATQWKVWQNGTIINPQSGLVLTAKSAKTGVRLTIENNIYATSQAWLATNNSKPFITSIVGFRDLCLQANVEGVWIIECESNESRQKWAIFVDGSIRPVGKQGSCLTCNGDVQGGNVSIRGCDGSSGQRWVFSNDGSVLNLFSGMVMDVVNSDPSLEKIIIWPSSGSPNQKWLPLLV